MSTLQHAVRQSTIVPVAAKQGKASTINRLLDLLCSVRFGIVLLVLLGLACMLGMLVMQQSVDGFDRYFADLTPAQKLVYSSLGLFDIYHSWYFNALGGSACVEHHPFLSRPVSKGMEVYRAARPSPYRFAG